jgi:asparagine synthase (glutamine-hydrolysing)
MQRPTIDGLNTYLVSAAVREAGFKVAISGLGGDEATGGYAHFRLLRYLPLLRKLGLFPGPAKTAVATVLAHAGVASRAKLDVLLAADGPREGWGLSRLQRQVFPAPLVTDLTGSTSHIASPEQSLTGPRFSDPFKILVAAEVSMYLQAMLLPDADAFSMASSVELRVPFVDSDIFAASLSTASGTGTPTGKRALGVALGDAYLQRLAGQRKRGFEVPMRQWMSGPLAPVLRAACQPDAPVWSVVDRVAAGRAGLTTLAPHERWSESWAIAALNAWLLSVAGQDVGEAQGCPS